MLRLMKTLLQVVPETEHITGICHWPQVVVGHSSPSWMMGHADKLNTWWVAPGGMMIRWVSLCELFISYGYQVLLPCSAGSHRRRQLNEARAGAEDKGGHSGTQIHLGRANANKLMNRFLKDVVRNYEARLSSIQGGSLRNAIPRESFAVIVPEQLSDDLVDLVQEYEDLFNQEFNGIEQGITFKAEKTAMPETLIPSEVQDDLINAVEGCPNGVISMLADFGRRGGKFVESGTRSVFRRKNRSEIACSEFFRKS